MALLLSLLLSLLPLFMLILIAMVMVVVQVMTVPMLEATDTAQAETCADGSTDESNQAVIMTDAQLVIQMHS